MGKIRTHLGKYNKSNHNQYEKRVHSITTFAVTLLITSALDGTIRE
jgi:hypothetical protein